MDLLEDYDGVVSAGERSWSVTLSVSAADAAAAGQLAASVVCELAVKAGMPSWPLVKSEVVRQDVADEDLAQPTMPELVSVPEAADILGVSKQRVHELAASTGFPEPAYELKTGKLWLRSAMEAYAVRRSRKPGRPPRNGGDRAMYISGAAGSVTLSKRVAVVSGGGGLVVGVPLPYGPPSEIEDKLRREVCQAAEHFAAACGVWSVLPAERTVGSWLADVPVTGPRFERAAIMSAMLRCLPVMQSDDAEGTSDAVYILGEKDGKMELIEVKADITGVSALPGC